MSGFDCKLTGLGGFLAYWFGLRIGCGGFSVVFGFAVWLWFLWG